MFLMNVTRKDEKRKSATLKTLKNKIIRELYFKVYHSSPNHTSFISAKVTSEMCVAGGGGEGRGEGNGSIIP